MRVAKNRETIRGMNVRILSGLRLEVQADPTDQGRYTLKTAYSQLLRSKYQVCMTRVHRYMTSYMQGGRNREITCQIIGKSAIQILFQPPRWLLTTFSSILENSIIVIDKFFHYVCLYRKDILRLKYYPQNEFVVLLDLRSYRLWFTKTSHMTNNALGKSLLWYWTNICPVLANLK